jgi:hypothetical protein
MGNADKRILNPRKTVLGARDSLENTLGATLHDGAQCYVIGEQANYRFSMHSKLPLRPPYIIQPIDAKGQWVRESGLVGFAVLSDGKLDAQSCRFTDYEHGSLVQFEMRQGELAYEGTVSRLALIDASAALSFEDPIALAPVKLGVTVHMKDVTQMFVTNCERPGPAIVSSTCFLQPGARIVLHVSRTEALATANALNVILL